MQRVKKKIYRKQKCHPEINIAGKSVKVNNVRHTSCVF